MKGTICMNQMNEEFCESYRFRTWAEINLDHLTHNVNAVLAHCPGKKIMAVIKANAYGHGDAAICRHLLSLGVDAFAVTTIDEAANLRQAGIGGDILIFGRTPETMVRKLSELGAIQAVLSLPHACALSASAVSAGLSLRVHIKLDTGMGRVGLSDADGDVPAQIAEIMALPGLQVEGLFTHLAVADGGAPGELAYTRAQHEKLSRFLAGVRAQGITPPPVHSLNSAGGLYHHENDSLYVRAGIVLYGQRPNAALQAPVPLLPVMEIKSVITRVKPLLAGQCVSYGCTFTAPKDMMIATVPIGYADGYPRCLSSQADLLVKGRRAKIVGRVCMDQLMVDVTDIEGVAEGDIATVFGKDGDAYLPLDELAELAGTISYEILCAVHMRVPRVYTKGGKVVEVVRYL